MLSTSDNMKKSTGSWKHPHSYEIQPRILTLWKFKQFSSLKSQIISGIWPLENMYLLWCQILNENAGKCVNHTRINLHVHIFKWFLEWHLNITFWKWVYVELRPYCFKSKKLKDLQFTLKIPVITLFFLMVNLQGI